MGRVLVRDLYAATNTGTVLGEVTTVNVTSTRSPWALPVMKSKISSVRIWPFLALARDEFMHQKMLASKEKSC